MKSKQTNIVQQNYFGAANSANGFHNLFDTIFSPEKLKRIYILKGGPGCGKSTTIKKISEKATLAGYNTENYYCSSSPNSLDGVIIPELSVAVVDGTSPHAVEPSYPGVCETIINLGQAWDTEKASNINNEIREITSRKRTSYTKAYAYLSAASNACKILDGCASHYLLDTKLKHSVERICTKIKYRKSDEQRINYIYTDCISTTGIHHLTTFEDMSETRYFVKDFGHLSPVYFSALKTALYVRGADITIALDPLEQAKIVGIYIDSARTCFTIYDDEYALSLDRKQIPYKIINTARFCNTEKYKKQRIFYRYAEKSKKVLMSGALRELENAGIAHNDLEKLYHDITDYSIVESIANKLIEEIFR